MPDFLGRYELIEKIGVGGMGAVHKARDPRMKRFVAIKTLLHIDDAATRSRFEREMQAAAALTHANIVVVYDCELDGESPYIVMELVAGESLAAKLGRRQRLPYAEALSILRDTANGLDFAHKAGIIHRDVKPGNVMLAADGRAKLADFGVAKIVTEASITAGSALGTPRYIAPEVWLGKPLPASDQFSLAVMAFHLLTGAFPFDGDMAVVLFYQIVNLPAPLRLRWTPRSPSRSMRWCCGH